MSLRLKSVEVSYSVKITAASALGRQIEPNIRAQISAQIISVFNREIPNLSNLWNIQSERHIYMKCLSIFKGHEHILGDKIAKFDTRALATLQSLPLNTVYNL